MACCNLICNALHQHLVFNPREHSLLLMSDLMRVIITPVTTNQDAMASLRRLPNSRNWIACFIGSDGKRYQRSTGIRFDGTMTSRRQAQRIAEEYEDAARKKKTARQVQRVLTDLYEEIAGDALPDSTALAFATKWLEGKAPEVRPHTLVFYRIKVDSFIKSLGAKASGPLREISTEDIRRWRDSEAKRLSVPTANHGLKIIRMLFGAARRQNLLADDPADGLSILKRPSGVTRRPFSRTELESILKVASPEWRSLILFGLYTGQRLGDLATLTWDKIDLEHQEIRLTTKKTARYQKIPINAHLLKHVRTLPKPDMPSTPVHPNADTVFKAQGRSGMLSRQFYELMTKAGLVEKKLHRKRVSSDPKKQAVAGRSRPHDISQISFHSLRHTTTSLLKNAGVSSAVAEEFVGHDSPEMNRVYTHIDVSSMRQAAEKLPDFTDIGAP